MIVLFQGGDDALDGATAGPEDAEAARCFEPLGERLIEPIGGGGTTVREIMNYYRQGCMLYELIPNMPEVRLRPLFERFSEYINQNKALAQIFTFV